MEQELATEPTIEVAAEVAAKPQPLPPLETWTLNEPMRHVPSIQWIIEKLERDVRRRIEILTAATEPLPASDPQRAPIEDALRSVCTALDRLADAARHSRSGNPPSDLASRISWSMNNAISSLRTVDANAFGRRYPFHTSERSKAEYVYAALLLLLYRLERVVPLVREADRTVDERLLQGLVNLQEPMRLEPMA